MFKEYLLILALSHILGDFYLQTDRIAEKKEGRFGWVLLHSLGYWVTVLAVSSFILSKPVLLFGGFAAVSHWLIDSVKYFYVAKKRRGRAPEPGANRRVFFIDQAFHLLSILLVACAFAMQGNKLHLCGCAAQVLETMRIPARRLIPWIFALLVIHKPVNIAISRVLTPYRPDRAISEIAKDKNAGRLIGTLERAIMLLFISLGQYSAIGLVLTAKSIARYDRIVKDPAFSEYYLLGTLLSALSVVVASLAL